jgi:hypothetical protein
LVLSGRATVLQQLHSVPLESHMPTVLQL